MGYGADVAEFAMDHGIHDFCEACELYNDAGCDSSDDVYNDAPLLIDTEERCRDACAKLLGEGVLAVDLEGVNLCRHGEICIITVATRIGAVFLFDVTQLGGIAFSCGLQQILESAHIEKLFFDCRADADALYHLFQVMPNNILDLQVLRHRVSGGRGTHVQGLATVLKDILSPAELQEAEHLKTAGTALFAPEKGGSYEAWKLRPLHKVLEKYCAQDVRHLFTMRDTWTECPLTTTQWRAVSERRMVNQIRSISFVNGLHRAKADFAFTKDWLCPAQAQPSSAPAASDGPAPKKRRRGRCA